MSNLSYDELWSLTYGFLHSNNKELCAEWDDLVTKKENEQMSNTKAEQAISQLFKVEDLIGTQDFTGLLEQNDNGYRERAVEHIKKAAQEIDAMMAAEEKQRLNETEVEIERLKVQEAQLDFILSNTSEVTLRDYGGKDKAVLNVVTDMQLRAFKNALGIEAEKQRLNEGESHIGSGHEMEERLNEREDR